jgi:hypothetical protein
MRPIPFVFALAACGGAAADSPLTMQLGLSHAATESQLRSHHFCLETHPSVVTHTQKQQKYPRCDRAASEHGDAWVIAIYDQDKLVELRRYERFGDDNRAVERWNELVAARMKKAPASDDALQQIQAKGVLPAGTRAVKAFPGEPGTVVGVYLLQPSPPENAQILEQVIHGKQ